MLDPLASQKQCVAVFCKYPADGEVKTRLAESIGDAATNRLYRAMVNRTLDICGQLQHPADTLVFCAPNAKDEAYVEWLGADHRYRRQSGQDLGERMLNAFERTRDEGYTATVLVGTDCPALTPALIEQAFCELDLHEIVLGPSHDGGYYLIGEVSPHPGLMSGIAWSTDEVLSQTLQKLQEAGTSYAMLEPLQDLDNMENLIFYKDLGLPHFDVERLLAGLYSL
ncbi:MAG: TIGR04282 family arsenosugar biosynthesis glycosyltransferase [Verrucomicrobia bacterium]|nr:TIGR04282 family arsenosugar biosynthesis glycosyltransferase [Verrucomicrobiota bacterium]